MANRQQRPTSTTGKASKGFTDEERAAMRERAQEQKRRRAADRTRARRRGKRRAREDRRDAGSRIAPWPSGSMRSSKPARRTSAPRTWYGMPAYAKDGNVVCFFQSAQKFKTRYATLGFSDKANLDEGAMWPTAFALKELTADDEARIARW